MKHRCSGFLFNSLFLMESCSHCVVLCGAGHVKLTFTFQIHSEIKFLHQIVLLLLLLLLLLIIPDSIGLMLQSFRCDVAFII